MAYKIKVKQLEGDVGSGMYASEVADNISSVTLGGAGSKPASTWKTYTISQVLDELLFPYQPPGMEVDLYNGSTLISGSVLEVGQGLTASPNITLRIVWNTTGQESNALANQVAVSDSFTGALATAQPINGEITETYPASSIRLLSPGSLTWTASGTNTNNVAYSGSTGLVWRWKSFWGTASSPTPTEALIEGLANNELRNSRQGTFSVAGGDYKYFAFPTVLGVPTKMLTEGGTGNALVLANTGEFNLGSGAITYAQVSVTNQYGQQTTYNVFRSKNVLTQPQSIQIT
jgi:hypothetical protein